MKCSRQFKVIVALNHETLEACKNHRLLSLCIKACSFVEPTVHTVSKRRNDKFPLRGDGDLSLSSSIGDTQSSPVNVVVL